MPQATPNSIEPTKYCLNCSYVLDGLSADRCPECGRQFDARDATTYGRHAHRALLRQRLKQIGILAAILVPLEIFCGILAYWTVGEVHSFFLLFNAVVGIIFVGLFLLCRLPKPALVCLLIVAVLLIPHQLYLGVKYCMLKIEAGRIVAYVEGSKRATGAYPDDLSGYAFQYPSLQEHFQHYSRSDAEGGYIFYWYVAIPGTSHWYSPNDGWAYYPD